MKLMLLKAGSEIWSIANQTTFILKNDTIIEIVNKSGGFVSPKQLLFNIPGYLPKIIDSGTDEWCVDLSNAEPYEVPKPIGLL